jgi:hypothetical protein
VVPVVIFLKPGTHPDHLSLGTEFATYLNFRYIACDLFRDFIENYANLSDDEVLQYKKHYLEKEREIMGLANLLREEGRKEGLKKGLKEGGYNILMRLMTRRFGILPEWARERLENADPEQIENWAESILDAKSLEEVFQQ